MITWLRRVVDGLRTLARRRRVEHDLDDELRAYLDAAVERRLQSGLTRAAAVRAAHLEIGSLESVKDRVREVGWASSVDAFAQDVRYSIRRLRATPGFSTIAILTLGLGIGANTAIFSLFSGLVLRTGPIPNLNRLVVISETSQGSVQGIPRISLDDYQAVERGGRDVFDRLFTTDPIQGALSANGNAQVVFGELVSGEYFTSLGFAPRAGRFLTSADNELRSTGTAIVISEGLWRRWFHADPAAIGMVAKMAGYPLTIVGVAPERFHGTWLPTFVSVDIWAPAVLTGRLRVARGDTATSVNSARAFALLRPGISIATANVAITAMGHALHQDQPAKGLVALPASRGILFDEWMRPALLVGGAVVSLSLLVFLIACANLTNLLLARGLSRTAEMAIRLTSGASRARIFRLLLTETALLTAFGGVAGLAFTIAMTSLMVRIPLPEIEGINVRFDPSPDLHVFGYAMAIAAVAAIAIGLAPAWRASRTDPLQTLAASAGSGPTRRGRRLRTTLVAAQAAMSIVLLLMGGLYVRSAVQTTRFNPGFDGSHAATVSVNLQMSRIDEEKGRQLQRRMLESAREIQGVTAAALASGWKVGRMSSTGQLLAEEQTANGRGFGLHANYATVSPGYFDVLRIPSRRGRLFSDADLATTPLVVIVNEAVAAKLWPGQDPLGRRLRVTPKDPLLTVVGVVATTATRLATGAEHLALYLPLEQHYSPEISAIVSSRGNPLAMVDPLRKAVSSVDPEIAIYEAVPVDQTVGLLLTPIRLTALVLGSLSAIGVSIAILGIYGVMSYFVGERTREFGIRKALGATSVAIYRDVAQSSLRMLLLGVIPGVILSFLAAGMLERLLYGVSPHDAFTFTVVPLGLVVAGLAAAAAAARRGARVDPNVALRSL